MGSKFTIYLKQKGGSTESAQKAIVHLKDYLASVVGKSKTFDSSDAVLVDENTTPTLLDTDVVVYLVRSTSKSVIAKKGGDIAMAEGSTILGLTDLNLKICEVYYDRLYEGSAKELSGAVYHEAAHIKSNTGNSMHNNQDGFLKGSPDYNGTPTDKNNEFLASHLSKKVSMNAGY